MSDMESVESFRLRAREWLAANLPKASSEGRSSHASTEDFYRHIRQLQRRLWDGGFAGIAWPAEYGGQGLTPAHQRAFTEECAGYEMPTPFNVPTFGILAATLLEFGTHEQKLRHIPAILKGDELWVQFLSEPSGGSDLAGCLTRADRDGDVFIMNGSKIWSSSAMVSDYAMCLARTNWDVPKHRGLTMFIMKIHQPGVEVVPIQMTSGEAEFCQEFFTDVPIPASDVVGAIDDGWNVASRLLMHERIAVGGASPYTSGAALSRNSDAADPTIPRVVRELGLGSDPAIRQLVAEHHVEELASKHLAKRITAGMAAGEMPPASGSLLKLSHAMHVVNLSRIAVEIAGSAAATGAHDSVSRLVGESSLGRQGLSLGGGSNEIQRNIISERVLGMPREWAGDSDIPYKDVRRERAR